MSTSIDATSRPGSDGATGANQQTQVQDAVSEASRDLDLANIFLKLTKKSYETAESSL